VLTDTLRRADRDDLIDRHLDPGSVETANLYRLVETTTEQRAQSRVLAPTSGP
jgi:hypothetical protein